MRRHPVFLLTVLLAACATKSPRVNPEPTGAQDGRDGRDVRPESPVLPDRPVLPAFVIDSATGDSAIDSEIAAELETAADSVADEAALEELAVADAPGEDAAPVSWDIDVESFGDHDRVQYYLNFFKGPGRERMAIWLRRLPRYEDMIRDRLQEQGLPGDLVYLALIESGFSNRAVSRARAVGMWQFMPATGRGYGLRIDGWIDERRDPVKATAAAARHLKSLQARFGSLYLAAAAYNGGGGRVGRALNALGDGELEEVEDSTGSLYSDAAFFRLYDTKHIYRETKDYVPKLIAAALIAKEPAKYGFSKTEGDPRFEADTVVVPDMTGLDVIAGLADTTVAEIRELNPQFLRLVTPPRTRSVVLVPRGRGKDTQIAFDALPEGERVTFREHLVKRGQTASAVARTYDISLSALYEANPRVRGRKLRTGERLVIPVGGAMSTVVARSVAEPESRAVSYHRVKRGETISGIAKRYRVSQSQLRAWNQLGSSSNIRAGQRIRVGESATERARVATGRRTHTVRPGETLSGISRRYGVSLSSLSRANGLTTRSKVRIGQKLRLPA